jgi:hypothetical protein
MSKCREWFEGSKMFRVWAWDSLQSLTGLAPTREGLLDHTLLMKWCNWFIWQRYTTLQVSHFRSRVQPFWYTTLHDTSHSEYTECYEYRILNTLYWWCYCTRGVQVLRSPNFSQDWEQIDTCSLVIRVHSLWMRDRVGGTVRHTEL